jgi:hypothetical protein
MATLTECRPDERLVGRLEPRVVRASFYKPHPIGSPLNPNAVKVFWLEVFVSAS